MRGADERDDGLFSNVGLEAGVPADHSLRARATRWMMAVEEIEQPPYLNAVLDIAALKLGQCDMPAVEIVEYRRNLQSPLSR